MTGVLVIFDQIDYTETLMEVLFKLVNFFHIDLFKESGANSAHQLPFDLFRSIAHFKGNGAPPGSAL